MLSWSAAETGRRLDLRFFVDPGVEPGIDGGRVLAAVGRAVRDRGARGRVWAAAQALTPAAGLKAAMVAGAFEILNRIVDATGLPVGRRQQEAQAHLVAALGLAGFPHAGHVG